MPYIYHQNDLLKEGSLYLRFRSVRQRYQERDDDSFKPDFIIKVLKVEFRELVEPYVLTDIYNLDMTLHLPTHRQEIWGVGRTYYRYQFLV